MMRLELEVAWVPHEVGGPKETPKAGYRCGIRWMKHIEDSLDLYRDLIIRRIDQEGRIARVDCEPITSEIPENWLRRGESIELLDGPQVIAVGRIAATTAFNEWA